MKDGRTSPEVTVLSVGDLVKSAEFYTEFLGGRIVHQEDALFVQIELKDCVLRLVKKTNQPSLLDSSQPIGLKVGSIKSKAGICLLRGIHISRWEDSPAGWTLEILDPDGYSIVMTQEEAQTK